VSQLALGRPLERGDVDIDGIEIFEDLANDPALRVAVSRSRQSGIAAGGA
jgi:hypothetical protein